MWSICVLIKVDSDYGVNVDRIDIKDLIVKC